MLFSTTTESVRSMLASVPSVALIAQLIISTVNSEAVISPTTAPSPVALVYVYIKISHSAERGSVVAKLTLPLPALKLPLAPSPARRSSVGFSP